MSLQISCDLEMLFSLRSLCNIMLHFHLPQCPVARDATSLLQSHFSLVLNWWFYLVPQWLHWKKWRTIPFPRCYVRRHNSQALSGLLAAIPRLCHLCALSQEKFKSHFLFLIRHSCRICHLDKAVSPTDCQIKW